MVRKRLEKLGPLAQLESAVTGVPIPPIFNESGSNIIRGNMRIDLS